MNDYLGFLAAALTTVAFVPQVVKIYQDKSAKSISLKTFYIFTVGVFLWLLYGIALDSWPMIVSNIITMSLSITILVLKHKYD
jgi:MtN3 and saliva related transmembrane protein